MDTYNCSFRCYFDVDGRQNWNTHYQALPLSDIPRWLEAYQFTHPFCTSISVKIWFVNGLNCDTD